MAGFRDKKERGGKNKGKILDGNWVVGESRKGIQQVGQLKNVFFKVKTLQHDFYIWLME